MERDFEGLTGRVVIQSDPDYGELRQGYNRAIQQYPLILNDCRSVADVSNAVKWARTYDVPLRIRSGGHNYEGYSNGDGVLVIDISMLNRMSLDEQTNLLTVEGGVTNSQVYALVASKGYPFPGGTCPTVGVSGYATGGGWGLSCRWLGLGCDSLEEIELVNFAGDLIQANRQCNADLFWACRGAGGGNFGVVVSMRFRLPPKTERVTLVEIDYLRATPERQAAFLETWQGWLEGADPRITLIARVYNSENDGLAMLVRGLFYGGPGEARQALGPFLRLAGATDNIEEMTFLDAVTVLGSHYPPYEKFQAFSRFVTGALNRREIAELVALIRKRPPGSVFAGLSLYALGGRVRQVGMDETAFPYRDAQYILWLETIWEEAPFAEANRRWIGSRFPAIASITKGSYVNFPYDRLPNFLDAYYGAHVPLLKEIKKKYDPLNVFTFPQGIESSGARKMEPDALETVESMGAQRRLDDAQYRRFRYVKGKPGEGRAT